MISNLKAHPFAAGYILLAMVYSLIVAAAIPLGMLGIPFILTMGYSFGHAGSSLLVGTVAFYMNRKFQLENLGFPKPVFASLLLGGLVPLVVFIGILVYYGFGFATFST